MSAREWHIEGKPAKLSGKDGYLWEAVGADGEMLDLFITPGPDEAAALAFFNRTLTPSGKGGLARSAARPRKPRVR